MLKIKFNANPLLLLNVRHLKDRRSTRKRCNKNIYDSRLNIYDDDVRVAANMYSKKGPSGLTA